MKRLPFVSTLAILTAACAPEQAAPVTLEGKVAQLAEAMGAVTPRALEGGLSLDAVAADGSSIVLKMSGFPDWRPQVSDEEAGKLMGASICKGAQLQALVKEGASLRIEGTTPGGEKLPPLPICSA